MTQKSRAISMAVLVMSLVLASVLWMLSSMGHFDGFCGRVAAAIISGTWGLVFLLQAVMVKNLPTPLKKMRAFIAIGLFVIAVLMIIAIFGWDDDIILPVIAVIVSVGLLIVVLAVKGEKWDMGDNQRAGYKTFFERKAEQEALEKKEADANAAAEERIRMEERIRADERARIEREKNENQN